MAIAHTSRPTFGVQFHPESVLTPDGEELLGNFLATTNETVTV
jgi:anthranilate/para-aminobenzoate synthase component II